LRLRVVALCIVHPIHHSRTTRPSGKAAVRDIDGDNAGLILADKNAGETVRITGESIEA